MTFKHLYIFDLDGTLALTEHRQHILGNKHDSQRWQKFFTACVHDSPNEKVIHLMNQLRLVADVWIWSGRSDEVKAETVNWLANHTSFMTHDLERCLRMRAAGDYTADDELKAQWLKDLPEDDRTRLVGIFDDRNKVVAMWRTMGITCFQVAPGEF